MAKKKYQPPSITGPESENDPKKNYSPAGITGCSYGAIGASCADGTEPSGTPASCNVGGSPEEQNCMAGTTAAASCLDGTDAIQGCDTGISVPGDCTSGQTPLGAICNTGTSASSCSSGTGG